MQNKKPLPIPGLRAMPIAGNAKTLRRFCGKGHSALVTKTIFSFVEQHARYVPRHDGPGTHGFTRTRGRIEWGRRR